ncbi:DUF1638 domain-containing protein [Maritimibacter sp. UBA3975]|uniref:DUF1638 domain-containing protein n=1 Tax=Maritimibacter sp. UBA3975 TaxID=1946833 RepID=UPI000C0B5DF4|nr:DUF1638 domain-containing protein [Maritimibacter sp. UBA3975]MAM61118.1 hypothetical protein [Maritimibacter sp.]
MIPDDADLRETGLAASGTGRVLVIGCGALAREILAVIGANGLAHVDVTCLPAILHNRPERIAPALEAAIDRHAADYDRLFVAYADCGSGGAIAALCARHGIEMIEGPHCYSFFEGNDTFAERGEVTAFYLTDFLARQFDAFVTKPLGLDRHPELRDMYFGNYETLVHLAQTDDPALDAKARAAADALGLTYERRPTGYGDLEIALQRL